jgi:protein transport protein SEC23
MATDGGLDFASMEDKDGLRFTWNEWPVSKLDAATVVIPVAAMYTPFKQNLGGASGVAPSPHLEYEPVRCKQTKCNAVLNPYW